MKPAPTFTRILIFSLAWLLLNLIQALFTAIIDDEAYYWVYSRALDWGYFDHPPMIALLIRIGYSLFGNELGVRLLNVIMGTSTMFIMLIMLKNELKGRSWIMILVASIPLVHFHVAGFPATPDIPLVFFSTLFLLLYKKYVSVETPLTVVLLALTVALMLYSKYHALLVIGFTVLSNLKLLRRRSFWLIVLLSVLFYVPHILWQVRHNFVSFGYHLVGRNTPFNFANVFEYIASQALLLGPMTGLVLLFIGLRSRPLIRRHSGDGSRTSDPFHAALKFNFAGFLLFFLFSTLKGHVEAHWTAAAFVPLVLYSVPLIPERGRLVKFLRISAYVWLPIIILTRILFLTEPEFLPEKVIERFGDREACMQVIRERAGDRPVVFNNSYQDASLFRFYTGLPAFSQNNKHYRRNQYDLMDMEAELMEHPVLYISRGRFPGCDTLLTPCGPYFFHETDCFCFFNRVHVVLPDRDWVFEPGERVKVDLGLGNPTAETITFPEACTFSPMMVYTFFGKEETHFAYIDRKAGPLPDIPPHGTVMYSLHIHAPETPGEYRLMFSFGSRYLPAGINGNSVRMTVVSRSTTNSGKN